MRGFIRPCIIFGYILFSLPSLSSGGTLFQETFDDANFASRGWYDGGLLLSNTEHLNGSISSAEFFFKQGGTKPTSGGAVRKKFLETDALYVSYYVKYSADWEGANLPVGPHEFLILTNLNGDWDAPAYSHLTAYIEQNEGTPLLSIQDGQNIDEARVGQDLTSITEQRAVAGCNGDSDGYGDGSCYPVVAAQGMVHRNGKSWKAGAVYFQDTPGPSYKSGWHFIEAYFKLNSVVNGKGVADGAIQYWFDGVLIIDRNNVMIRTGQHPNMKFNQFMIAPYMGDGSPIDQTFWVDNLTVATSRGTTGAAPPSPPKNLRVK